MCVTCGGLCVPCRGVWVFHIKDISSQKTGKCPFSKAMGSPWALGQGWSPLMCPEPADVTGVHWTPKVPAFHQPGIGFPAPFSSPKPLLSFGSCEKWRLQGRAKAPVVRRALGAPAVGAGLGLCLWQGWR